MISRTALLSLLFPGLGCVVWMRAPEPYREEVVELVELRKAAVQRCYDAVLEREQLGIERREREAQGAYADIGPAVTRQIATTKGVVVVEFRVAAKTGEIEPARIDDARTTAPPAAVACVIESMRGMKLDPPDEREGRITLAFALDVGRAAKTRAGAGVSPVSALFVRPFGLVGAFGVASMTRGCNKWPPHDETSSSSHRASFARSCSPFRS